MILIRNGIILTQNKNRQIIKNGAILIKDKKIFAVGKSAEIEKKYKQQIKQAIEAKGKVVMPGLVNAHTHLAMTLLRGIADDLPLEEWWFEKIHPIESRFTKKDVYLGSLLGGLEMIKSGTTCFADFYYFEDEVAHAAKELGLRANLGVGVLDFETFAFKNASQILKEIPLIVKRWRNDDLIKISLAPHMIQTTSLETYKKCRALAKKYNLILQTHLAETKQETDFSLEKYGLSPAKLLIKNRILDSKSLAAHCCYLTDKEIKMMVEKNIKAVHCPISNMKLASGNMPLEKMRKAGIVVALGTDSVCSNNNLDMFEEMKMAALLHKLVGSDPTLIPAQYVLDMATINGAKALGFEREVGSIDIGKRADIIVINFNAPHLLPLHNIVSHLVYSAQGADVETALVNGKIIMQDRKILTCDEQKILAMVGGRNI